MHEEDHGLPGATRHPRLAKIVDGGLYLDPPLDSSLEDVRKLIQGLPREILCVFDASGKLAYAPLIGEEDGVHVGRFMDLLNDCIISHNHPNCTMLSHHDLRTAIETNAIRIEAICKDGTLMSWDRPAAGWPNLDQALKAYRMALGRAAKNAKPGGSARKELRKQCDRSLGDSRVFGNRALKVGA